MARNAKSTRATCDLESCVAPTQKDTEGQMKRETLKFPDEYWAVFNNHVNNAGKRALRICNLRFATEDGDGLGGLKALNKANRSGIMAIFNTEPTLASTLYASLCFVFANGLEAEGHQ